MFEPLNIVNMQEEKNSAVCKYNRRFVSLYIFAFCLKTPNEFSFKCKSGADIKFPVSHWNSCQTNMTNYKAKNDRAMQQWMQQEHKMDKRPCTELHWNSCIRKNMRRFMTIQQHKQQDCKAEHTSWSMTLAFTYSGLEAEELFWTDGKQQSTTE